MSLYMTAWFEGKNKKGKWFLANPRFVNLDNPEKVNITPRKSPHLLGGWDVSGRSFLLFMIDLIQSR